MKKLFIFFTLFLSFNLNAKTPATTDFISAFEDIPLQEGLIENDSNNLSFDTEDIRVIEQYVSSSKLTKQDFLKFYKETLNSLGWKLTSSIKDKYNFRREEEVLIISIESEKPLVALFTLKPVENNK